MNISRKIHDAAEFAAWLPFVMAMVAPKTTIAASMLITYVSMTMALKQSATTAASFAFFSGGVVAFVSHSLNESLRRDVCKR